MVIPQPVATWIGRGNSPGHSVAAALVPGNTLVSISALFFKAGMDVGAEASVPHPPIGRDIEAKTEFKEDVFRFHEVFVAFCCCPFLSAPP